MFSGVQPASSSAELNRVFTTSPPKFWHSLSNICTNVQEEQIHQSFSRALLLPWYIVTLVHKNANGNISSRCCLHKHKCNLNIFLRIRLTWLMSWYAWTHTENNKVPSPWLYFHIGSPTGRHILKNLSFIRAFRFIQLPTNVKKNNNTCQRITDSPATMILRYWLYVTWSI